MQAVSELYTRRKWLGQAAGEAALLVVSKAFHGEGEFSHVVLPLLVPLLKGKDGSNLQVPRGFSVEMCSCLFFVEHANASIVALSRISSTTVRGMRLYTCSGPNLLLS